MSKIIIEDSEVNIMYKLSEGMVGWWDTPAINFSGAKDLRDEAPEISQIISPKSFNIKLIYHNYNEGE